MTDDQREAADEGIRSATKDEAHITPEWDRKDERIEGVRIREVKHIITGNGVTTELFRKDWGVVDGEIVQAIHVTLNPQAISAWHMHKFRADYLFVVVGMFKVVLYDDRDASPTRGRVDVFHLSAMRPLLVSIPPEVWHGVQVLSAEPGSFVNLFNQAYDYEDPDEWRLPPDSLEIPYRF